MAQGSKRRLVEIDCDGFGRDELKLRNFQGHEELGRLFEFHVDVLADKHDIALERFLGKKVTVTVPTDGGSSGPGGGARQWRQPDRASGSVPPRAWRRRFADRLRRRIVAQAEADRDRAPVRLSPVHLSIVD